MYWWYIYGKIPVVNCNSKECKPMTPIEHGMFVFKNHEIKLLIDANPTHSIQQFWEKKEVELVLKYDQKLVARYWPDFASVDIALFVRKNKHVPSLLKSLDELKDLPEQYKLTKKQTRFFASPVEMLSYFITFSSLTGLAILSKSTK